MIKYNIKLFATSFNKYIKKYIDSNNNIYFKTKIQNYFISNILQLYATMVQMFRLYLDKSTYTLKTMLKTMLMLQTSRYTQ
jgi:hypothetical protein